MWRIFSVLLPTLAMMTCLVLGCRPNSPVPDVPTGEFLLGGIEVNEPETDLWLDALARAGMNTVSVTNYASQGVWNSADLTWSDDPSLVDEIRRAKERGFKVVLILRVALSPIPRENRFLWHGMVLPRPERRDDWFDAYRAFALHWAEIAQRQGVDVFILGSELNALTSTLPLESLPVLEEYYLNDEKQARRREEANGQGIEGIPPKLRDEYADFAAYLDDRIATEQNWARAVTGGATGDPLIDSNSLRTDLHSRWEELAGAVREVYSGRLGYAANFDQYQQVGFWKDLDVLGINAYFPLRDRLVPASDLDAVLRRGWEDVFDELRSFRSAQRLDLPVLFTEIGYTPRRHSTLQPWASHGLVHIGGENVVLEEQPQDLGERAAALQALYETHAAGPPLLHGLLYWKLSTIEDHVAVEPFLMLIGGRTEDPLEAELRRFLPPSAPGQGGSPKPGIPSTPSALRTARRIASAVTSAASAPSIPRSGVSISPSHEPVASEKIASPSHGMWDG